MLPDVQVPPNAASGIAELDDILGGGYSRDSVFLIEGKPGTGKTTIALQFLMAGAAAEERGLHITLSETENELRQGAASHGWVLGERIEVVELVPAECLLDPDQQQSLLYSSDLELGETTQHIFAAVERWAPRRVVLDSLSEIRLLAQSSLRYRRQILALKHYFAQRGATVLLLDDLTADAQDKTMHSVAHGVIRLSCGACGSASIAAGASAAATTISSSNAVALPFSRGWSRPSIAPNSSAPRNPAASPPWTPFWAGA